MIDYKKLYSNYDKEDLVNTCVNLKQYKEHLRKEVNKSYIVCNEKDKEIERLKSLWETDKQSWNELMAEKETEIERLNNIINESINYIKENCIDDEFYVNLTNKEKGIIDVLTILQNSR